MKKLRNKILSAVLVLSLLLTSSSFAFAEGEDTEYGTKIEPDTISLKGSSRDGTNTADKAFDGNESTAWESSWDPFDESRFITLDLGSWTYLSHLTFIPRKGAQFNGTPKYLYVYVSDVTSDISGNYSDENYKWKLAKIVDWSNIGNGVTDWHNVPSNVVTELQKNKEIEFSNNISTRYVKLYAPQTYTNGDQTLYITDLTFYKNINIAKTNIPTITTQPQSNIYLNINEIAPLNVTVTEDNVTYQWYKTEDGTLDSGVVIPNAIASTYQPTDFGNYFVKVTSADGSYVFSNIAEIKAYEAKIGDNNYETFADAMQNVQVNGTIEILTDITISSTVNVNKSVTIKSAENDDGSVYTMNRDDALKGDMFKTSGNGNTLTLENIIVDGGAEWTGETDSALGRGTTNSGVTGVSGTIISVTSGCTFNFEDGAVLQNGAITSNGGAIYNASGTINLNGGKIKNNAAGRSGGAIYSETENGVININENVIIEGNSAGENGAVLFNNRGEVNIDGSIISMNKATNGGAVYVNNGTVNLNRGTIKENSATNGGAVYVNNGTLNLGEANNDYALTISGNTATNGDSIYYGGTGTININAKLKLDGEIYLHTNGMKINQKCDLSGSAPITLVGNRSIEGFITVSNDSYKSSALNVFRVKDQSPNYLLKPTAMINADLSVVRTSNWSNTKALENGSTYYRGIENNLYTVTGSGSIKYIWYEKAPDSNEFTKVGEDLNLLSDGTYTVYCVASDDTNYMVSDVAEITVKDFYPCSKAIDKFKNI